MKSNKLKEKARRDFSTIARWIKPHSRVLDLGCGDGGLLRYLKVEKQVSGYGIEIDDNKVIQSVDRGINVIQGDLETRSSIFNDESFDYVILSLTLQAVIHAEKVVLEMLRIGGECIVTFPNFGYWGHRLQVLNGIMPVSKLLPYQWYNTPNLHLFTVDDFEAFCKKNELVILDQVVLNDKGKEVVFRPNLFGALAFYHFAKKSL